MKPYDITIRLGAKSCHSLVKGLVAVGGQLTDSYKFPYPANAPNVAMRIIIPDGSENDFTKVSGIELLQPFSPKAHIEGNPKG